MYVCMFRPCLNNIDPSDTEALCKHPSCPAESEIRRRYGLGVLGLGFRGYSWRLKARDSWIVRDLGCGRFVVKGFPPVELQLPE